ncbi:MAG: type VI secretion system tube protein TssD [Bacteroidota bacterium]
MPLECALDYEGSLGIVGGNTKAGREDTSVVIQANHSIYRPTDSQTGLFTGARVHGAFCLIKEQDEASPLLFKACSLNEEMPSITIRWYRVDDATGTEVPYYEHTLTNAKVSKITTILPNTKDKGEEQKVHLEEVEFRYEQIMWTELDNNITHTDSWAVAS